jgi:hypothetical protein
MTGDFVRRSIGLLLVLIFLLAWEPNASGALDRIALPILAALGAYLVIGSVLAVAIAVAALAAVHSDLGAADWIASRAYPGAALAAGAVAAAIAWRRFGARVRETRDARRRARVERTGHSS